MEFKEEFKKYQEIINYQLVKYYEKEDVLEQKLEESARYSLLGGGKRLRPILVLATYNLFKEDVVNPMAYAVAIEMVHNFSLIHDDLPGIDNDDLRHGKPTNHKCFGEATAILAGDMLLNKAYMVISQDIKNSNFEIDKLEILNEFTIAVDKMIKGEFVDTEFEKKEISKEVLEYIHINKTGALIELPVRMGAILRRSKR